MSLLEENMQDFVIINKAIVDDGYGGHITTWTDGATIQAAITYSSSGATQIAQALGSTSVYTITVKKDIELDFHTVVRRVEDGKIFRVTANSDDNKTPKGAGLNMRQYSCEEWSLPNE